MREWSLRLRLAASVVLAMVASAAHADPRFYYCWAPDPASGKVFVSETRPVGPIAERASYGATYSAWLRANGKIASEVQAYCMMRDTEEGIAQSRAALPVETCRECGSARNFVDAAMGGPARPARPASIAARPVAPVRTATVPPNTPAKPAPKPAVAGNGPWIIVLGNVELGRTVWSQGGADLQQRVDAMALKIASSGWTTLVSARTPGAGAAMCVKDGNRIRFFTVFPRQTYKQAIGEAQAQANAFAGKVRQTSFSCGAWVANDRSGITKEKGVIDYLKDGLFEMVSTKCDETLPPVVVNNYGIATGSENPRQQDAGDARKPCKIRSMAGIGVRG